MLVLVASLVGNRAAAEPMPIDPYAAPAPAPTPAPAPAPTPARTPSTEVSPAASSSASSSAPSSSTELASDRDSFDIAQAWDDYGIYAIGGLAALIVVLVLAIRTKRARRRRRALLDNRRTQFGRAAIDPSVALHHRAAWEAGPVVRPAAIDPLALAVKPPSRQREFARGSELPPFAPTIRSAQRPQPLIAPPIQARPVAQVMYASEPAREPMPWIAAPPAQPQPQPQPPPQQPQPPPQPYPLTFAASQLVSRKTFRGYAVEPPVTHWECPVTEVRDDDILDIDDGRDFEIQFARGSQDDELERARTIMRSRSRSK